MIGEKRKEIGLGQQAVPSGREPSEVGGTPEVERGTGWGHKEGFQSHSLGES